MLPTFLALASPAFTILPLGDSITYGCGNVDTCGTTHDPTSPTCGYSADDPKLPARFNCSGNNTCPYTPCPTCMGDAGSGSYRTPLKEMLEAWKPGHFEFVGTQRGGGTAHMGFPGWRIDQIYNISSNWTALKPDAIALLIGTNDVMQGPMAYAPNPYPPSLFPQMPCDGFGNDSAPIPWHCDIAVLGARMDTLLDRIFERLPDTQLFVATITGLPTVNVCYYWDKGETDQRQLGLAFNALLPALVAKQQKRGFAATLVDLYNATGVGVDGQDACPCHIHPNDAGYSKMAKAWFEGLKGGLRLGVEEAS